MEKYDSLFSCMFEIFYSKNILKLLCIQTTAAKAFYFDIPTMNPLDSIESRAPSSHNMCKDEMRSVL